MREDSITGNEVVDMLRDIPRVYMMMFAFIGMLSLLVVWYASSFQRDTDVLHLNESVLSGAVSSVDPLARIYPGALLLADDFEETVWKEISASYPTGSTVVFEYVFDTTDTRFSNVEVRGTGSPPYRIGGSGTDVPSRLNSDYMTGRPVKAVRVKIKVPEDDVTAWTYVSTVRVDAASRP